jgi:gas vesicle protein
MTERVNTPVRRVPESQPGHREANTAFLRAEIRETRERMSETLDELSDRLNPNRLKAQVKENIREATVGRVETMARNAADRVNETGHGMVDKIRANPIPAAMIGIGLGWLLFGGRRRDDRTTWERSYVSGGQWDGTTGYVGDLSATTPRLMQDDANGGMGSTVNHDPGVVDRVRDRVTGIGETVRDTTSELVAGASERVGETRERVVERVSDVTDRAGEKISDVADRARYMAHNVSDGTRRGLHTATDRFDTTLNENPVAIGVVALAVGMAAGLAIPESRRERELMGPYRDQLADRVRDRVDETRERVQHVADRVVEETKDAAREVVEEAKTSAKQEGLMS